MKFTNFTSRFFFVLLILSSISNFAAAQFLGPVAICRNYTASITPNGVAVVNTQNINNGSYGYNNMYMIYNGTATNAITFTCNNVGQSFNIVLYVEDSLLVDTCTAVVTVTAPAGACNTSTANVIFSNPVNATNCNSCNGQLAVASVGGGGAVIPGPYSYLWSNGATTAQINNACPSTVYSVTVTTSNTNNYLGTATVGCNSSSTPNAVCNAYTVSLNPNGIATVSAQQLGGNSTGGVPYIVGINGQLLNNITFNCTNLGANSVVITVLDSLGNSSNCTATVYVVDQNNVCNVNGANPTANCVSSLTVDLSSPNTTTGAYAIVTPQILNNGSLNAASMWIVLPNGSISYGPVTFSCNDLGTHLLTLVVSNSSNNAAGNATYDTCTVLVTITDTLNRCGGNQIFTIVDTLIPSSCNGQCSGYYGIYQVLLANGASAPAPLTVVWSDGFVGSSRFSLCGNQTYQMTIYDAMQNVYQHSVFVPCNTAGNPGGSPCFDPTRIDTTLACPTVYAPVCGCNGITYSNACEAEFFYGITSWTSGPCNGNNGSNITVNTTGTGCNGACTGSVTITIPNPTPNMVWFVYWSDSLNQTAFGPNIIRNGMCQGVYFANITDNNGLTYTVTVVIGVAQGCVWPGDADDNAAVNNWDLLPISLVFGETGVVRPNASNNWMGQACNDWTASNPIANLPNYKHIDCDGNGIIDQNDLTAVQINYGLSYNRGGSSMPGNIPFYVSSALTGEGQSLQLPIMLGTSAIPANNIYGIAFSINYDPGIVEAGSINLQFNNSWLGTNLLNIQYDFSQQGVVEVAVARRDRNNISGFGEIGMLNLTIQNDILRNVNSVDMNMDITNIRLIQNDNTVVGTNPQTGVVTVNLASSNENIEDFNLEIYPNPAQSLLNVKASNAIVNSVAIYNINGQLVQQSLEIGSDQKILDLGLLTEGVYMIQVLTDKGLINRKIVVKK